MHAGPDGRGDERSNWPSVADSIPNFQCPQLTGALEASVNRVFARVRDGMRGVFVILCENPMEESTIAHHIAMHGTGEPAAPLA